MSMVKYKDNLGNWQPIPAIQGAALYPDTGAGAPSANADYVGQIYVDTTNDDAYIAIQMGTGITDWKKITP